MKSSCWKLLILAVLLCAVQHSLVRSAVAVEGLPSDVTVKHDGSSWVVSADRCSLTLDEQTLGVTIQWAGTSWRMEPSGEKDCHVQIGDSTAWVSLRDARTRNVEEYETGYQRGVKVTLGDFTSDERSLDITLSLFICIEMPSEELTFTVIAEEGEAKIKRLNWPGGFTPGDADFTVVPFMQGMLLPRDWPHTIRLYDNLSYGRGLYMPWWGQMKGTNGYIVILETPADGGCTFTHPAEGATDIAPLWVHSLGSLAYPRTVRYAFFDPCDHVTMAKRYRRYVQEKGTFVSLKEKIARTPNLGKLIGSPVVHTSILYHIQPDSSYYNKDEPEKNHQLVTFDERAAHLRALRQKGVGRAYVHLDGWGYRGYDNLHPDVLPPCPEAGGWDGMKRFADVCDDLGYVFAIHDQYRDYYLDAASYDDRHTIILENGKRPYGSTWHGGKQSLLCAALAPGYVRRNYNAILDHGVKLRGAYLDVFAVVVPEECYNEEHPMTRTDCMRYRAECFAFVRSKGGIVSSEEPVDWAIPHIDLVHHGPYALDPNPGHGPAFGIPVPLFSLVYHDALLLPWSLGKGAWGIPETDLGMLHALLNAGMPYLSVTPDENELERVRAVCKLHDKVALLEMVSHEFLDRSYRKQRSVFSDGTQVNIDLDAGTYEVTYDN